MGHTHELVFAADQVVKRFRSWDRGEHVREWTVLCAVSAYVPELVPRPLTEDLAGDPPSLTMTRVPGDALVGPLTADQVDAVEVALRRLWSVPTEGLPARRFHPEEARAFIDGGLVRAARPEGLVGEAYDLCRQHLAQPMRSSGKPVLGHGDGNLSNYLWDGRQVRLVDFEDAGHSTIEYELATLIEHLAGRDTDWSGFLGHFEVDADRLRSARLTVAAQWLLMLLPGGPAAGRNPPQMLEHQAHRVVRLAAWPDD